MIEEFEIHEILFNSIVNGTMTQTIRLGKLKVAKKFKFISSYTKRIQYVELVSAHIEFYNKTMNLEKYYDFINTDNNVTIINFKLL
jgi:hypothetical protein